MNVHLKSLISFVAVGFFLTLAGTGEAAWEVSLQVTIPDPAADSGNAKNRLVLGLDQTATDGFDNTWDTVAYSGGALNAHFVHPEYAAAKALLWQDLRDGQLPKTWDIEVTSPLNGQARITWDTSTIPSGVNLHLVDEQTGGSVNMISTGEYAFMNTPSTVRKLSVQASQTASSAGAGGGGGGGCGYIKNIGGGSIPPSGYVSSAALNLMFLFLPLLWMVARKFVLSHIYINGIRQKGFILK